VFLDAQEKRTRFLTEAVESLDLQARVRVITERAEQFGQRPEEREQYDAVVARSFAAPAVTAECAAPLLRLGAQVVVSEPPGTPLVDRWPDDGLALVGLSGAVVLTVASGSRPVHLARMRQVHPCPDRYPRRVGVPAKRPLF
jgi:16S rRNA (guanine527-N7)-methyltransferase